MAYRVNIESFEGPFDLLLALVSEQKVDIGRISVAEVADQYLAHIDGIRELDMDVASGFLVVASTLLALKTAALLPDPSSGDESEPEPYSPSEARDLLVSRLMAYKQFKNAAAALNVRLESEGRMHARHVGLDPVFSGLLPDYLDGVSLESLAVICADLAARREVFLLEASHIVSRPIAIEGLLDQMLDLLGQHGQMEFRQLLAGRGGQDLVVAGFLSLLEMYHRGMVDLEQADTFGDILVALRDASDWSAESAQVDPAEQSPVDAYLERLAAAADAVPASPEAAAT